jgi:nucleoid DNA-binding protein/cell division protein FtsL
LNLYSYIKELLFLHDCVIIPEFGGFVANYRPARINHENNTIVPPGKDISFNKSLNHNDGLLISYISESRGVGYVDAKRIVTNFVHEVNRRLEKGIRTVFDDVGTFYYDTQKNLQFEPDPSSNFLLDSYGLSEFSFAPLEQYDVQKRIRKKFLDKEPSRFESRRKVLWRIAIAIPLLVALVVIPLKTDVLKFKSNVSSLSPVSNTEVIDSNLEQPEADVLETDTEEKINAGNSQEALSEMEQPSAVPGTDHVPETIITENLPVVKYFIIAGSFRNVENSERYREELTKQGYSSIILDPVNELHRVTLSGYPSKEEAVSALAQLRKDPSNKEMWILRK